MGGGDPAALGGLGETLRLLFFNACLLWAPWVSSQPRQSGVLGYSAAPGTGSSKLSVHTNTLSRVFSKMLKIYN